MQPSTSSFPTTAAALMLLLSSLLLVATCSGFSTPPSSVSQSHQRQLQQEQSTTTTISRWQLSSTNTDEEKKVEEETNILDLEEPAGIVGAAFFGGNKEKEEYYDPDAEAKAGDGITMNAVAYERFADTKAFDSKLAAQVGRSLQAQITTAIAKATTFQNMETDTTTGNYYPAGTTSINWDTCFTKNNNAGNPLAGLKEAADFYKKMDVAIVSGKQISDNRVQLQWQIGVVWPLFWEPRVLLTGMSDLTFDISTAKGGDDSEDTMKITKQVDTLDSSSDILATIGQQLQFRFWDVYHIGMTPSAELMSRTEQKTKGLFGTSYKVFEVPGRVVSAPSQLDSDAGRLDGNAQMVPNHAFSCVVKTMGPKKDEFVPASPLEVQISSSDKKGTPPLLTWSVPLGVAFQSQPSLPLPGEDEEARPNSNPTCQYEFQPRRLVATLPYGGKPQDKEISEVRKQLYDAVVEKDGYKPKLDENGRPQFFFWQNSVKACSTVEGLGMCVYEWRPASVKPSEVGIELEMS